jgi:hypothetical protein
MPIVSIFLGIVIRMFHDDHPPPHFHAAYGEYAAVIDIATGGVLGGDFRHASRVWWQSGDGCTCVSSSAPGTRHSVGSSQDAFRRWRSGHAHEVR